MARKRGVSQRDLSPVVAGLLALQQKTVPTNADNWDDARAKAPAETAGLFGLLAALAGAENPAGRAAPTEEPLLTTTREGETQTEAKPTTLEEATQTEPPATKEDGAQAEEKPATREKSCTDRRSSATRGGNPNHCVAHKQRRDADRNQDNRPRRSCARGAAHEQR